jgi:hypothetical protein
MDAVKKAEPSQVKDPEQHVYPPGETGKPAGGQRGVDKLDQAGL